MKKIIRYTKTNPGIAILIVIALVNTAQLYRTNDRLDNVRHRMMLEEMESIGYTILPEMYELAWK